MKFKGFWYLTFIVLICISLYTGTTIYEQDIKDGVTRDIYNYTENSFTWNSSLFPTERYNASSNQDITSLHISNIINKIGDALGYSVFEGAKFFIEVGYNSNGAYDLGFMLKLIQIVLWIIVIAVFFYPAMIVGVGLYELVKYINKKTKNKKVKQNEDT